MTERGAGLPRWSLSPVEITARFANDAAGWFGPSEPQAPGAPADVAGRQWDFPSGYNLGGRPRNYEAFSFADLRMLADAYDLLRLVIETRKDQIERMNWAIRAKAGASADAGEITRVERFLQRPDGAHDFSAWMRMILEDLFVIDAPALWCERDRTGALLALHPLDGATIKPVLDAWGRAPRPFAQNGKMVYPVAYQQILKGLPAVDYSARDLLYRPRNVRAHRAYGFSPVEQVMATVNIGLKRQLHQLNYYSEGNVPESLIGVPDSWTPDQIKNFQDYWDLYFTGDSARRRRAKFVPGGVAKTFIQTKEPELKNAFDEWIARVVCFAFSISPQAFVNQMNRSTSETQKEAAEEEGLLPILGWIKRLCDHVIQNLLGADNLEFVWRHEAVIDPTVQRENLVAYVNAGMMTRRRAAQIMGETLPDDPMADVLAVTTGQGVVGLGGNSGPSGVGKRFLGASDEDALFLKYSPEQPRDEFGRWIGQFVGPVVDAVSHLLDAIPHGAQVAGEQQPARDVSPQPATPAPAARPAAPKTPMAHPPAHASGPANGRNAAADANAKVPDGNGARGYMADQAQNLSSLPPDIQAAAAPYASALGQVYGSGTNAGQCAQLTHAFDTSLGPASTWQPGEQVQGADIPAGTAVATFNDFGGDGKLTYGPAGHYGGLSGSSHTGIYLGQDQGGLYILNQWNKRSEGASGAIVSTIPWTKHGPEGAGNYYTIRR
jgi:hypothetical protein